ncbi:unnamed protein product [Thlaspi arvense]|uniref:SAP domain-containing protein n=1 Tax=Thlaspi arvense TaxID=13288 RepID=A0AAU9SJD6_THLAR|nr:unnamed protein product [Thlaspi arvense]
MDFHGMKRKDLQALCKKHGIPGNLKNTEMSSRLASLFETETEISPEESVMGNQGVSRKAKKVTFSPESENQVFEFTRSAKKLKRRSVSSRSQQSGIKLRRSKRNAAKGISGIVDSEGECSSPDIIEVQMVPRRSKRLGSGGSTQEDCKVTELIDVEQIEDEDTSKGLSRRRSTRLAAKTEKPCVEGGTSKAGPLLPAKRSKQLDKDDELVKSNVAEVSVDVEVPGTRKRQRKGVQDDSRVEKFPRRSRRFVNDIDLQTDTHDQRKSVRVEAVAAKESKEERKTKRSKGSSVVSSGEGELVKNKTKGPSIDLMEACQDVPKAEVVTRRSKRLWNNVNVPIVDGNVKTVKGNDLQVEKAVKQSRQLEKSVSEREADGQAQKGGKQPKRASGNDHENVKPLRRSKRTASMQLAANNPEADLVVPTGKIHVKDIASTVVLEENAKTKDETLICTPTSELKDDSSVAKLAKVKAILETSAECWKEIHSSKDNEKDYSEKDVQASTLHENFSECNTQNDSAEEKMESSVVGCMSAGRCGNLTPEMFLEPEEAGGTNVEARCTSKKLKTIGQEFAKDKQQIMAGDSPSSSEAKATEPLTISENDFDSTLKVPSVFSLVRNVQELSSELKEGECEEKHEQDAVLIALTKKDKEEASKVKTCPDISSAGGYLSVEMTPITALVQLATSNPEAELGVSTVTTEKDTNKKEEALICTPRSELKDLSSVAELAKVEAILENSVTCCNEIMAGDTPSSSAAKATDPLTISENVFDSTLKFPSVISLVRNVQELSSELMEGECEEKHEQDAVLIAVTKKDKDEPSTVKTSPDNSSVGGYLSVEMTPLSASVQLATSNPEVELGVSTVITEEDTNKKEETLICTLRSELKDLSSVAKSAKVEAILENSAACCDEIHSSKNDDKGSLEKDIQAENLHGNFSEYNTETGGAQEQAVICKGDRISVDHCVNLETLDDNLEKSERSISSERGCKRKALELSGYLSTDFAFLSPMEENVSECVKEVEMKALSQPIPINKAASSTLDEPALFTTPERNLMLMEKVSENGKRRAVDSVTHHNDEAVESHAVVFTTPEQVLLLGDSGLDEVGKEEEHTATNLPGDSDVLNSTERDSMLQNEARNEGESVVVELHDDSNIATTPLKQSSVGDFEGDGIERNEENKTELHCESGTCTTPDSHAVFGNSVSDGAENSGGSKATEFNENPVVFTGLEVIHEGFGYSGQDEDPELGEAEWLGINIADKSSPCTSLERQLLYGDSEQKKAVKTAEKAAAEFHDDSFNPNFPERHPFAEEPELVETAKSDEDKAVELQVDCDIFTGAEKQLLLETEEGLKGNNIIANSHEISDVLTASEGHSRESDISTDLERRLLSEDSGLHETRKMKDNTSATCEEYLIFTSPEKNQLFGNSELPTAGKQEGKVEFKDESALFTRLESRLLLEESGQDRLGNEESAPSTNIQNQISDALEELAITDNDEADDLIEANVTMNTERDYKGNLLLDSSGGAPVSGKTCVVVATEDHEHLGCNSGEDFRNTWATSGGSRALEDEATGPIATPFAEKAISLIPNEFIVQDNKTEEETTMEAERNAPLSPCVLTLPAEGDFEIFGENSSHFEIAGTSSMESEESSLSLDIQNQIKDALEESAVTDNNEADELTEAKVTRNLDSSVSEKTCVLGGTEDEHLGFNCEVENTCDESGRKFLKDEATDPMATAAFEKEISPTPDEFTVTNNRNEEADEETIKRETTPSAEKTLNEYLNTDASGTSSENQVRGEPVLIYRTEVKPKRHVMKENAPYSKIVDNLNVTAPRTSKRQPLQDLRKN